MIEFWVSVGVGILSALIPVANAEAYVVGNEVAGLGDMVPVAVGIGVGQTFGKVALFLSVRWGRQTPFVKKRRADPRPPRTRFGVWLRRTLDFLVHLIEHRWWGVPILFLAASVGIPPLYPVAFLAGATRINVWLFTVVVLVGRQLRFLALALGVSGVIPMLPV